MSESKAPPSPPPSQRPSSNVTAANGDAGEAVPSAASQAKPEPAPQDPLAEARAETARMKDAWMRSAADFDNFRKRSRRELEDARKAGREDLLKDLLPVFDNLERGIQSAQQAADVKAVTDGLGMIQMRERAALVGGRVQVRSGLGLGTEVRVTVPDSRATT